LDSGGDRDRNGERQLPQVRSRLYPGDGHEAIHRGLSCPLARELSADTFLDILSLPVVRDDYTGFQTGQRAHGLMAQRPNTTMVAINPAPPDALQPDRELSLLLQNEVQTYYKAEQQLPRDQQTNIDISRIKTEGEASAYIRQVVAKLHPQAAQTAR